MSRLPRSSPWGAVQRCEVLSEGVYRVCTRRHDGRYQDGWFPIDENLRQAAQGGILVRKNAAGFLSPEARKEARNGGNYLCYAENGGANVVIRELLDKGMWQIPGRLYEMARYEDGLNKSLQNLNPEYWEARQQRLAPQPAQPQSQTKPQTRQQTTRPQTMPKQDKPHPLSTQHRQAKPPTLAGRLEAYKTKAEAQNIERKTHDAPHRGVSETVSKKNSERT